MQKSPDAPLIGVVDDHPIVWSAITTLLSTERQWKICGDFAADSAEAKAMIERHRPTLVIIDISLKGSDGLELIKDLHASRPDLKILVFSQHDEMQYAQRVLRAGASGYVMKTDPPGNLLQAIRAILSGELYMSPRVSKILLDQAFGKKSDSSSGSKTQDSPLTDREMTVLELMGQGLGTRQIAGSLSISIKTVEAHRANLKKKLGMKDGVELLCYASRVSAAPVSS